MPVELLEVVQHPHLSLRALHVDGLLRDTLGGHLGLDVLETHFIVAYVVGHVAVRVDGQ